MAELFGVETNTVNYHLKEIFKSGELEEMSVIRNFRITAADGKNYNTQFYNLDAIIAVGYRVNSHEATRFRIWATKTLKEFIIKGFVMDDERLKQGKKFGKDYFEELLERIREIRASERRFYQKITDIYAQCSIDYDPKADITLFFYKTVQNKLKTRKELTGVQLKWYKSSSWLYSTGFFLQKFRNWQNYCRHAENPWYKMGYVVQWL